MSGDVDIARYIDTAAELAAEKAVNRAASMMDTKIDGHRQACPAILALQRAAGKAADAGEPDSAAVGSAVGAVLRAVLGKRGLGVAGTGLGLGVVWYVVDLLRQIVAQLPGPVADNVSRVVDNVTK